MSRAKVTDILQVPELEARRQGEMVRRAAARFFPARTVVAMQECGQGNVNDTFLVTLAAGPVERFILQRLNPQVFPEPRLLMHNLRVLTEHVQARLLNRPLSLDRRWELPRLILTPDGADHWVDGQGSCWRALSYIASTRVYDTIQHADHAREVGLALGMFHLLIHDLPVHTLADTLPGFHITPNYLRHFDEVVAGRRPASTAAVDYALAFIRARRGWAPVLELAREAGTLSLRPTHGDPKVNNVLLDAATGQAAALIDLDTVKPGLVQVDLGDCLRSACNPGGEETSALEQVHFNLAWCRSILEGYLTLAREFLTDHDYDYFYDGIRLIAFELGLRFFTDYLAGNVYFKTKHPGHNLTRALVQFKLTESIEAQETAIRRLLKELQ